MEDVVRIWGGGCGGTWGRSDGGHGVGAHRDAVMEVMGAHRDAVMEDMGAHRDAVMEVMGAHRDAVMEDMGHIGML